MTNLLLVEDDPDLCITLEQALSQAEYSVEPVTNGELADQMLLNHRFDVIVLDLGLPRRTGLEVLQRLRGRGDSTPVLILTASAELTDRVRGLRSGADDYLAKPFALIELEARLEALVRRIPGVHRLLRAGRLKLSPGRHAEVNGAALPLTLRELQALECLMSFPGQVVKKSTLAQRLGAQKEALADNAVSVLLHRLRRKLQPHRMTIRTVYGVGYVLEPIMGAARYSHSP